MPTLSAERREEKFARMRERMLVIQQAREKGVTPRMPSPQAQKRKEKLSNLPAHLEMFRVPEVAYMLGVSSQSVHRWFADRAIKVLGPGGQRHRKTTLLISRAVLEDWMREHT